MTLALTSSERIRLALRHSEPDRVPLDIGSNSSTGISVRAYALLRERYGITSTIELADQVQQLAVIDESLLDALKVDTRGVSPNLPFPTDQVFEADADYRYFTDPLGIRYAMPIAGGIYFDMVGHPLPGSVTRQDIGRYRFPEPEPVPSPLRVAMRRWVQRDNPPAIVLEATPGGILEISSWLRGYEDFLVDLAGDPPLAQYLMERVLEYKLACWEAFFRSVEDDFLVVFESDDLGTQNGPMISPDVYRTYVKPLHRRLFDGIRRMAPRPVSIALHTCGSVHQFLPDLVEIGLDILNPVQVSAQGMDTKELKKRFGRDLTFWGGGVDTQRVLPFGTPQEVRDEVRRRIDDLAPGGGFVFATVHNIQAFVPPENIIAMLEAFEEVRAYR
jgi:uroporphyrinogen decarboxylase